MPWKCQLPCPALTFCFATMGLSSLVENEVLTVALALDQSYRRVHPPRPECSCLAPGLADPADAPTALADPLHWDVSPPPLPLAVHPLLQSLLQPSLAIPQQWIASSPSTLGGSLEPLGRLTHCWNLVYQQNSLHCLMGLEALLASLSSLPRRKGPTSPLLFLAAEVVNQNASLESRCRLLHHGSHPPVAVESSMPVSALLVANSDSAAFVAVAAANSTAAAAAKKNIVAGEASAGIELRSHPAAILELRMPANCHCKLQALVPVGQRNLRSPFHHKTAEKPHCLQLHIVLQQMLRRLQP
mmetsp:Transcript_32368/g.58804  ORF Transcript_32368/g.58804 Transcript_32368/m.58804 type:complete len:300 (+) Transcript_32368:1598-2497(+)